MEDFLAILLRGLTLILQAWVVGGSVFAVAVVRPLCPANALGRALRLVGGGALALAAMRAAATAMLVAQLVGQMEFGLADALGAAATGLWGILFALVAAALGFSRLGRRRPAVLLLPSAALLAVAVAASHAWSRLDGRNVLVLAEGVHQAGAAIWLGGIPFLLVALAEAPNPRSKQAIVRRFSTIAMAAVAALVGGAAVLATAYIPTPRQLVGTGFGAMVMVKLALLLLLLLLGLGNLLAGRRLDQNGHLLLRLKRFAEIEIGIGVMVFLAAASLASQSVPLDLPGTQ